MKKQILINIQIPHSTSFLSVGQQFTLSLKFSWFYNEEAPQVKFIRVPFHPNGE